MMGSGPWRMLADDGHVAYCFLMGASTNQKTVCYAAYHPQMLLIIRLTKQSAPMSVAASQFSILHTTCAIVGATMRAP